MEELKVTSQVLPPLDNFLQVGGKIRGKVDVFVSLRCLLVDSSVVCIHVYRGHDFRWKVIYEDQEKCGPKQRTLWDTSIDLVGLRSLPIDDDFQ